MSIHPRSNGRRLLRLVALSSVLMPAGRANAVSWFDDEQHALPCRPTIACTADFVPPGGVEVEVGYLLRKLRPPALQHSFPILAKLTLAEWVQLQLGGNGPTFANAPVATRYLDDLVAGFKFHFADQSRTAPSISLSIELSSPASSAQGFIRSYDLLYTLYATKDFRWLHADLNVGLNLWQLDGPTKPQPWVALALSVELKHRFTVMAESYYFGGAPPLAPKDGGFLAALAYAPRPWVVLDIGGDVGYVQSERSFSLFTGMTIFAVDLWQTNARRQARLRR